MKIRAMLIALMFIFALSPGATFAQSTTSHIAAHLGKAFITDGDYPASVVSLEGAYQFSDRGTIYSEIGYGFSARYQSKTQIRKSRDFSSQWQFNYGFIDAGLQWKLFNHANLWLLIAPSIQRYYRTRTTHTGFYDNKVDIGYEFDASTNFGTAFGLQYTIDLTHHFRAGLQVQTRIYRSNRQMNHGIGIVLEPVL